MVYENLTFGQDNPDIVITFNKKSMKRVWQECVYVSMCVCVTAQTDDKRSCHPNLLMLSSFAETTQGRLQALVETAWLNGGYNNGYLVHWLEA